MESKRFTRNELKSYLEIVSSVHKLKGKEIIWRRQAILDKNGQPVPLEEFLELTGQRTLVNKERHKSYEKTPKERGLLKACKKDYKDDMKALFNGREDWRIISRKMKIFNVPESSKAIQEIQKSIA